MSEYKFWDEDVENIKNQACNGNADIYEIMFKQPVEAMNIHKDDVVHLANLFGLAVYDANSAL